MKKIAPFSFSLIFVIMFFACTEQKVSKGDKLFTDKKIRGGSVNPEYSGWIKVNLPNDVRILSSFARQGLMKNWKSLRKQKLDFERRALN